MIAAQCAAGIAMSERSFTGRRRLRVTRRGVRVAERVARLLISIGGLGTIVSVTMILVFLVWVVLPLFLGASVESTGSASLAKSSPAEKPAHVGLDPHGTRAWSLDEKGVVTAWRTSDGALLDQTKVCEPGTLSASAASISGDQIVLGFRDGTIRTGTIGFAEESAADGSAKPESADPSTKEGAAKPDSPAASTQDGGAKPDAEAPKPTALSIKLSDPIDTESKSPILLLDRSQTSSRDLVCALDADRRLMLIEIERHENLLTGELTATSNRYVLPFAQGADGPLPEHVLVTANGGTVFVAWRSGRVVRYDTRDAEHAAVAEEKSLVENGAELTSLCFLLGKNTLISGDSRGNIRGWFCTRRKDAHTSDGSVLVMAHDIDRASAPVVALAPSARSRVIVVGSEDGVVSLYHVTSHKRLARESTGQSRGSSASAERRTSDGSGVGGVQAAPEPARDARSSPSPELAASRSSPVKSAVDAIAFSPKEDAIVALGGSAVTRWSVDLRHPEASLSALFAPVWYEGYEKPEHVWQSTSGTDDFEPKLGLMPLVFGTMKATFYSMLFGLPIALLAAIYTSEFLKPRLRAPLKSVTEMMASLPSVVLGFMAALVIAPFAKTFVPAILTSFVTIPFALLLGAHLWQLVPQNFAVRWSGAPRFALIWFALPLGALAAFWLGPLVEKWLFGGNLLAWLDRQGGSAIGGWVLLLLPISILAVIVISKRTVEPWLRRISATWSRNRCARFDLAKLTAGAVLALVLASGGAWILDALWMDPRGGVLDTYVQSNALVVGFVMGFAVIPIIYTLAEDALSSVPQHLRLASLGAGATPWQTAVRVVIPTAMSGLFSAAMIGLGRVVGETMIVLMATGNTPVMSWNVFNGLRTLSANLATELPEAVQNSTHYRTLFLAALCLFAMTFVFNTLAEVVRQRFRKRAYQL
jgi:phosphate transport system permease protein